MIRMEAICGHGKERQDLNKLTVIIRENCPYCDCAMRYIDQIVKSSSKYSGIEIERIDDAAAKKKYDYYYLPAFFKGEWKILEGGADHRDMIDVLDAVLEQDD
jgi:hypothetical protein